MIKEIDDVIGKFVSDGLLKNCYLLMINPHIKENMNPAEWLESRKIPFPDTAEYKDTLTASETLYFLELTSAGELEKLMDKVTIHAINAEDIVGGLQSLPAAIEECLKAKTSAEDNAV